MSDPYRIEGPAVISFSGGRTSSYMLWHILQAWDGTLPDDVLVIFADTGKERPATLTFIDECERRWGFPLIRVMRPGGFDQLLADRKGLPNGRFRWCTGDLKIKEIAKAARARGLTEWTMVLGLRYDEPRRVHKKKDQVERRWDYAVPLHHARVTEQEVMAWWATQPFDLQLKPREGNCDLCFMKGKRKLVELIAERPDLVDWWIEQEDKVGSTFSNRHSYRDLAELADHHRRQLPLFSLESLPDDTRPCFCTE